jgi:hypothetical protein
LGSPNCRPPDPTRGVPATRRSTPP